MEAGVFGDGDFDAATGGFQMPVAVARRIASYFDAPGGGASFDVVVGTGDGDGAAGCVGFDPPAGALDSDGAGECASAEVAFDRGDFDAAGSAVEASIVPKIAGPDGAAGGFDLHRAIDAVDVD